MNRRGPIIAGAIVLLVALLTVFLLVLPKMSEVGAELAAQRTNSFMKELKDAGTESRISIVPFTTGRYQDFFEFSKTLPGAEGIVLKHKTSRFIGSVRKSVDNPMWLKVKWREGADGQLRVA